ncbi:Histone deacetylase hdt1 [Turnera subulata]|uniref:Histone deacetylase hdt1 n=1 Tax=Turnera subulata TaxID=218843 RepID=A0A9Q0F8M2_9ROSI|nr:Histone deacetylase hdt1 [Turnera subulata]
MEFWGEEVKAGVPTKVKPHAGCLLHLSQAVLGEAKKDKASEPVLLSVKIDGKKFVIATLKSDSIPQWSFDLVFPKEFELSHNWKHGSVYFTGYLSDAVDEPYPFLYFISL